MNWGAPEVLSWLWLLLPAAWAVFHLTARRQRRLARLADPEALAELAPHASAGRRRTLNLLWLAAGALLAAALARPQWGLRWQEVRRRGLDLVVVLDTSRSMLAEDLKPNRLQQAQWGVRDMVEHLRGDRVGLVVFAGSSFLQCPLTTDYAAFLMTLDDVHAGIVPRGGTAIAQALHTAVAAFDEQTAADRVMVLVTDGDDHEGAPLDLLPELRRRNIRLFAIGVGSAEGDLIPATDGPGRAGFLRDPDGRVVTSRLNRGLLEALARGTNGLYVQAAPGDFGVARLIEEGLGGLQRDEHDARLVRVHQERYAWLVGAALLLLAVEAGLGERVRPAREERSA